MFLFISHSKNEKPLARALDETLKGLGYSTFFDEQAIQTGDVLPASIASALDRCDIFIVLLSPGALRPDGWVMHEVNRIRDRWPDPTGKVITAEAARFDVETLPPYLRSIKWLRPARDLVEELVELVEQYIHHSDRRPRFREQVQSRIDDTRRRIKRLRDHGLPTAIVEDDMRRLKRLLGGTALRPGHIIRTEKTRYLLCRELGVGGFGRVWEAVDPESQQRVALKVLKSEHRASGEMRERFFRGARAMARMNHRHIVKVLDVEVIDEGEELFVMECIPGKALSTLVLAGELPLDRIVGIIEQLADALDYAHRLGLVHRDVKPSNVIIQPDGDIKLTDFDLVTPPGATTGITDKLRGTVGYVAPEVLASMGAGAPVDKATLRDPRIDVYGLASTAIFMLFGKDFPHDALLSKTHIISNLNCPGQLESVLARGTALEPEQRLETPGAFAAAFSQAFYAPRSSKTEVMPPPAAATPRGRRPPPPRKPTISIHPVTQPSHGLHTPPPTVAQLPRPAPPLVPIQQPAPPPRRQPKRKPAWRARSASLIMTACVAIAAFVWWRSQSTTTPPWSNDSSDEDRDRVSQPTSTAPEEEPPVEKKTPTPTPTPTTAPQPRTKTAPRRAPRKANGGTPTPSTMASIDGGTFSFRGVPTVVRDFRLDRTEVTLAAYDDCVRAGRCDEALKTFWGGSHNKYTKTCNAAHPERRRHPVNCVDWDMAHRYCRWRNKRLPSSAEWEYAARGGAADYTYPWGDAAPSVQLCWSGIQFRAVSCPTASTRAGAFGLYDMAGNVWEWTATAPCNIRDSDCFRRVNRGGGFSRGEKDPDAFRGASSAEIGADRRSASSQIGMRCAR